MSDLSKLAGAVTDKLTHILENGRPDCEGLPQSADISAAINWLKHNNVSVGDDGDEKLDQLRQNVEAAMKKRGAKSLPPIDDEDDGATA